LITVRREYKLGEFDGRTEEPWQEPSNRHCKLVEAALREFTELDEEHRIKDCLCPATSGARSVPILKELLQIEYFINAIGKADLYDRIYSIADIEAEGRDLHREAFSRRRTE